MNSATRGNDAPELDDVELDSEEVQITVDSTDLIIESSQWVYELHRVDHGTIGCSLESDRDRLAVHGSKVHVHPMVNEYFDETATFRVRNVSPIN